jgi:hypothetical protein
MKRVSKSPKQFSHIQFQLCEIRFFRICIREDKKAMKQYRTNTITP